MSNKHSFNLTLLGTRIYNLVIDNFSFAASWFQTLKIKKIKFTISSITLLLKFTLGLKIKRIKWIISNSLIKLTQNLPMTLYVKPLKFSMIMKLAEKWSQTVKVKMVKITAIMRQILRMVGVNIKVKRIKLVAVPLVAQFRVLSYYDSYYLSTMDTSYLSDLEYVVAP